MRFVRILLSMFLLLAPLNVPARADFKYTETTQITGGALKSMTKVAGIFSKQAREATKPIATSHYVKGDRMRSDSSDGTIQIIDLAGRRFITIDTMKNSYFIMTFDDMKASMEQAQAAMKEKLQEEKAKDPKAADVQTDVTAKVKVLPGTGSREVLGQSTNEVKMQIDLLITAQQQPDASQQQQGGQASGMMSTTMDTFVAPSVKGYDEFADFYKRMAQEINWTPPSGLRIDPRTTESLSELEKNSALLKGFPLLKYISMTMVATNPDGTPIDTSSTSNNSSSGKSSSSNSSSNNSSDVSLTNPSDAIAKGIGGLFNRKKKQDDAAAQSSQNPPPPSTPGSLVEMTSEVNSYSTDSLDSSLFEIPAAYTLVQPPAAFTPNGQQSGGTSGKK